MAKVNENGLSDRQQAFCNAYLKDPDHNVTNAAIAAGYSKRSAYNQGHRLMKNDDVRAFIDKKMAEVTNRAMKRFEITQDRILQELACMAFLDPSDLYDDKGNLLPIEKMPEHARRAIAGMDIEEMAGGAAVSEEGDIQHVAMRTKKLKLGDKKGALELLGKNQKMWTDRFEGEFTQVNMSASLPRESKQ